MAHNLTFDEVSAVLGVFADSHIENLPMQWKDGEGYVKFSDLQYHMSVMTPHDIGDIMKTLRAGIDGRG